MRIGDMGCKGAYIKTARSTYKFVLIKFQTIRIFEDIMSNFSSKSKLGGRL